MDLSGLREEYGRGGLDLPDLAGEPIEMFERWLEQAVASGVHEPNAMVVATADAGGRPSSRMVLLKGVGPDGFVFFTNHSSRKGGELAANPHCALLFPWHPLERQVRVEGVAARLPDEEGGLLPLPPARRPARGLGLGPVAPGRLASRAGGGVRPGAGALRRRRVRRRGAGAAGVGWLPRHARRRGVLAGTARADARPAGLPSRRRALGRRTSGSLRCVRIADVPCIRRGHRGYTVV